MSIECAAPSHICGHAHEHEYGASGVVSHFYLLELSGSDDIKLNDKRNNAEPGAHSAGSDFQLPVIPSRVATRAGAIGVIPSQPFRFASLSTQKGEDR